MIYFDSSALVKLVRQEAETPALARWVDELTDQQRVTSSLARVEVVRAVRGQGDDALRQAGAVLVEIDQLPMTFDVLDAAGALPLPLRSPDAIHLATAIRLRASLTAFVTYDKRLLAAAEEVGLPVACPGAP
ncbi:type II toxin-antitoxin system VapC family toxin [Streptoalloteichus hindustanus]|uniref:Ribonuclease VapC n=1 Tax=Streptoalloteichus hindustanus TaxID=2017 RepID=A0A1M5H113_STRHI|nr:type II toxin-antitoxin system VapC family toxin [Streptoalloteichus hindustanus]SHG09679.1 hypothetical protein SAMN05444320_106354 [Streptoalloteichus hindustanus]